MTATASEIAKRHVPPKAQSDLKNDILAYGEAMALAAVAAEREACAKIARDRAKVCQYAYDAGDKSEVHPLNEALHIAQLILARNP